MAIDSIYSAFVLIFVGASLLSTAALYTRQSLLVAYMLLGGLLGPWGLQLVGDVEIVNQIGEVGITFLLFLLGLHLQPKNLLQMLRKVLVVAVISSCLFFGVTYGVCRWFEFSMIESLVAGAALMFSSTIIGLKLLPTTILHHQHTGEVMISVLLFQDIIAIATLLTIQGAADGFSVSDVVSVGIALPAMVGAAFLIERYVLIQLFKRFDQIQEYIFLLSIGWCLGFAELGGYFKVSSEIGAFIAGVALAANPISAYIADSLRPLRDFFLVMFFFSIGAGFNFDYLGWVWQPAVCLAVIMLLLKPYSYAWLLRTTGEQSQVAMEVGVRLGQASEFSILVAAIATCSQLIGDKMNYLVQLATMLTFFASSYIVVLLYPTPLGLTERMRRD